MKQFIYNIQNMIQSHMLIYFFKHVLLYFQEKEEVEGISVGAILSDYQRVRVENV